MNTIDLLRNKGLKKTAQRVMLINILQKRSISLTEGDIKMEMGDLYDRITFYRTVQTLLETEIIHKITVDNITKYVLNDIHLSGNKKDHAHFYCKSCHSITCLDNISLKKYNLPEGFKSDECEILIKGSCNKCSEPL